MTRPNALLVERTKFYTVLTFNRPAEGNTLTEQLLSELTAALEAAERDDEARVVVLRGKHGVFCTGMDFKEFADNTGHAPLDRHNAEYMALLTRFSTCARVVIAEVDGSVMAGGMGILAACDLVISTQRSTFALPEALWGLLPCMVMPFLIRRVGFQAAYRMTLTTAPISASEAHRIQLVDELGDDAGERVLKIARRLMRLDPKTVADLKAYFKDMWILSDQMKTRATNELSRLMHDPRVQANVRNYAETGRLPWERS